MNFSALFSDDQSFGVEINQKGKMTRPKQDKLPITGPGVTPAEDAQLDSLCDSFIETRDEKAKLAEKLTATEGKILDRMAELAIKVHRFGDQVVSIKNGKVRVKIKTVKNEGQQATP